MPRPPRRFFNEMSGGQALFPLIVLVGLNCVNQLDVSAFGDPRPRHPRLVPSLQPGIPDARRAHPARRAPARDPARLLLRPAAARRDRGGRRRDLGRLRAAHRARAHRADARDRPLGRGHRPGGDHAVAQLAALRLLPTRSPARRVRLPRDRARDRRAHRAHRRRAARPVVRLAAAVLRVRDPHRRVRHPRDVAARAGPRALGTPGRGRERRGDRHRRDAALLRRVDPHPVAGRHAAAHLVLAAVPRGVVHRAGHADVALLRAGLPPRRLPAGHGRRARRARADHRDPPRHPARVEADAARSRRRPADARVPRHRHRRGEPAHRAGALRELSVRGRGGLKPPARPARQPRTPRRDRRRARARGGAAAGVRGAQERRVPPPIDPRRCPGGALRGDLPRRRPCRRAAGGRAAVPRAHRRAPGARVTQGREDAPAGTPAVARPRAAPLCGARRAGSRCSWTTTRPWPRWPRPTTTSCGWWLATWS